MLINRVINVHTATRNICMKDFDVVRQYFGITTVVKKII